MQTSVKTVACPECGEIIMLAAEEVELSSLLVCENCYSTLEITAEDPIQVVVVDVDPDELDEEDFDDDEDE